MNLFWYLESCVLDVVVVNVIKIILLIWLNFIIIYLYYRNFFILFLFLGVERRKGWQQQFIVLFININICNLCMYE